MTHSHLPWCFHIVTKSDHCKAPETAPNSLTFLKSALNPTLTLSAYPFPILCSWILFLTTGLTWIKRESSVLYLLGVCFFFIRFFIYFPIVFLSCVHSARKEVQTDCLLILLNAFRKSKDFLFSFYPAELSFSITMVSTQIIITYRQK